VTEHKPTGYTTQKVFADKLLSALGILQVIVAEMPKSRRFV
jgi:hypothetical protein